MLQTTTKIVKDGPRRFVSITTTTDTSKPKCWVEGHEYKFNSEVIVEKLICVQ